MNGAEGHDPVAAIAESEATGETAAIFADIRKTMEIPLITSIWRTLAGVEGGLPAAWEAAKPLFETGQPAASLLKLRERAERADRAERVLLPVPEPPAAGQLACSGVSKADLTGIRALVAAYNRSNGMNLMALTALVVSPAGTPADYPTPSSPPPWPELPRLQAPAEIPHDSRTLLQQINRFGADAGEPGLATLWRHLARWPGLLAVLYSALAPLERDGTIRRSARQIVDIAQAEGARIAHLRPGNVSLPEAARTMIVNYVGVPGLVARMVSIGHGLARWLEEGDEGA
jgi:hypothetical protein